MLTIELFEGMTDPRRAQGRRYAFAPLMTAVVLSVLCGATSYRKMEAFIRLQRDRLNALLGTDWGDTPTYGALRDVMLATDPILLESAVRRQAQRLQSADQSRRCIAIDGKVLRGSAERLIDQRARQILSALDQADHLVLGQCEIADKTNEIPVAQQMIRELGLEGCLFTLDALHCQKNAGSSAAQRQPRAGAGQRQPAGVARRV
jgi:hypothetical protein